MKPEELLLSLHGVKLPEALEEQTSRLTVGVELDSDLYAVAVKAGLLEVQAHPAQPPNLVVKLSRATLQLLWGEVTERSREQLGRPLSRLLALEQELATHLSAASGSITLELDASGERHLVQCSLRTEEPGAKASDCTLSCSLEDLRAVLEGLRNPLDLFFEGKLKLRGEPGLLMLLSPLFTDEQ